MTFFKSSRMWAFRDFLNSFHEENSLQKISSKHGRDAESKYAASCVFNLRSDLLIK